MYRESYLRPKQCELGCGKAPVGVNTLNKILSDMCSAASVTAHCLRVTCATKLFNSGIDEKLIRDRTGHLSNALFQYEKPSVEQATKVSSVLGAEACTSKRKADNPQSESKTSMNEGPCGNLSIIGNSTFHDCDVKVIINRSKSC